MSNEFAEYVGTRPALIIKGVLDVIHEPGEVFEVRIPKTKAGTISGYFNDTSIAASLIAKENGKHTAIYATVNPVNPALLARNENRFEYGSFTTSSDADIERRRWFLLDFDAKRPAGISSTGGELLLAQQRAGECRDWLTTLGWPDPLEATSGNGFHLMYRCDAPNDDASRVNFEMALKMLSSIFSDDRIDLDITNFNASRVWKIYGTISRKGSSTEDRPHRVASVVRLPRSIEVVPLSLIENVAAPLRDAKAEEYRDPTGEYIQDMPKWLEARGLKITSGPRPMFGNEGQKWTLSGCPFNTNHSEAMVGLVTGRPVFRCLHHSCSAFRWKEFREKVDPTYKDPDTVYARLLEWSNGNADELDGELAQAACTLGKKLQPLLKRLRKDAPRDRVNRLDDIIKGEQRRFRREVLGDEHNEKGNLVGLVNRVRALQEAGHLPMYWTAEFDHKVRVGTIGDIDARRLSTTDEIDLLMRFHSMGDTWVKQTHTSQVIAHLAQEYTINPLKTYLKSFRWDGTPRISTWLATYMGAKDGLYTSSIGRKWLISAVARGMDPGCQADHMLIFEGHQGIGKSQALRALGGRFYIEYSGGITGGGTGHKDLVAVISGKLIVEMSELSTVRRAEMEALKAVLTTTVDEARLSYERDAKSYPRTCVFSGTTNEVGQSYIADITGARRFWPVHVGEIRPPRIDLLKQDCDQLWAEAVEAYENGEDWWSVPVDETREEQQSRQVTVEHSEPWYDKIRNCLTDPDTYKNGWFHVQPEFKDGHPTGGSVVRAGSTTHILAMVLGIESGRQSHSDAIRLAKILRVIGFEKRRPSKKWDGATYVYDLDSTGLPHLWPAILEAAKMSKLPWMQTQKDPESKSPGQTPAQRPGTTDS